MYRRNLAESPCRICAGLTRGEDESRTLAAGVVLSSGQEVPAVLVVDTSGARSKAAIDFLKERGLPEVARIRVDPGLSYYTRYFQMPQEVGPCLFSNFCVFPGCCCLD